MSLPSRCINRGGGHDYNIISIPEPCCARIAKQTSYLPHQKGGVGIGANRTTRIGTDGISRDRANSSRVSEGCSAGALGANIS
jgi:hypothetical protein